MHLDFWNNPLVVSAFRVKYRRGGLASKVALYLLLLAAGGAVGQYYQAFLGGDWPRKYFLILMGVQFLVSVFVACITTAMSMRSEVMNRTLDFQRIAALSPRQILWGKLLGEPALAYLLPTATVPLAVGCWLFGGVAFEALLLVYLTLATSTLLAGSCGLINRLEPTNPKNPGGTGGEGVAWGILGGLLLPVPVFIGLALGDSRKVFVPLFGAEVPAILVVPVVQLVLAVLPFKVMVRLLTNPLQPPLGKGTAYVTLALFDLFMAAVLYDGGLWSRLGWGLGSRSAGFSLAHLLACAVLVGLVTPRGEIVETWVWRFRGRRHPLYDWLLGERSPNGLALAVFYLIGLAAGFALLGLPEAAAAGWAVVGGPGLRDSALPAAAATGVLLLAFGVLLQLAMFQPARERALFANLLVVPVLAPFLVGKLRLEPQYLDLVLDLSPIDQFRSWLAPHLGRRDLLPLVAVYGLAAAVGAGWLFRRLRRLEKAVAEKLRQMGVRSDPPAAGGPL